MGDTFHSLKHTPSYCKHCQIGVCNLIFFISHFFVSNMSFALVPVISNAGRIPSFITSRASHLLSSFVLITVTMVSSEIGAVLQP